MGLGPAVNLRLRLERSLDPGEPDAGKSISTRLLSQDKGALAVATNSASLSSGNCCIRWA